MRKMKREAAISAIKAAGAAKDKRAFMRLYVENRIALSAAIKAFDEGKAFAQFIADRDAANSRGGSKNDQP